MSSHSTPTTPRRTLVDLEAPSSLTGRPVKAPPPMARDEQPRQRPRISVDITRSRTSQAPSPQSSRASHVPSQNSKSPQAPAQQRLSQASSQQRLSQVPLSRNTLVSLDMPTSVSFGGSSGRQNVVSPNGGSRLSSVGSRPNLSPVAPPTRPFARRKSPASSTGDSSSGKAPLTPRDGSETRSAYSGPSSRPRQASHGHGRKPSVTFEDEDVAGGKGKQRERDNVSPQEARRRERRRSEARAAIEVRMSFIRFGAWLKKNFTAWKRRQWTAARR